MALTTTLASPPAPSGFALFNNAPAANLSFSSPLDGGQSVCSAFWGDFGQSSADCLRAVAKLPTGDSEVAYTVHTGIGPHHLPQSSRAGNCEVQIEIAGQRVPPSFALVPNDIRTMAVNLIETCGQKADKSQMGSNDQYIGGFTFGSLHNMIGWLTSEDGDLDKPMPFYTSFPTISISTPQSDYLSPGNDDPFVAHVLAQAVLKEAGNVPPGSRMAATLAARGRRLLKAEKMMERRGMRIQWWNRPPELEENATAANDGTAPGVVTLPGSGDTGSGGTQTARKLRRRRDMAREEGADA